MKTRFKILAALLLIPLAVWATDLTFSTNPQTTDTDSMLLQRQAVALNSLSGGAAAASVVSSSAYEASHVIKASPGTLIALVGYNSKASAQFVEVFNSTTVPADTAVPIATFTVAATSNFSLTIPITGLPCSTGIAVSNSSTGPTKTLGSADCFFTAVYK